MLERLIKRFDMRIILKKFEGVNIALIQRGENGDIDLLPTRYDLYPYDGGISWGYKGSGVMNLAYAIAAQLCEGIPHLNVSLVAKALVENLLQILDEEKEHILDKQVLAQHIGKS
tara:strand:- start:1910 stop:2254 length:345 start_codon:yes stop_codon:yes gene_type:complete